MKKYKGRYIVGSDIILKDKYVGNSYTDKKLIDQLVINNTYTIRKTKIIEYKFKRVIFLKLEGIKDIYPPDKDKKNWFNSANFGLTEQSKANRKIVDRNEKKDSILNSKSEYTSVKKVSDGVIWSLPNNILDIK